MFHLARINKRFEPNLSRKENNFDLLRLLAASGVIIAHSPRLLGKEVKFSFSEVLFGIDLGSLSVTAFFIISGFLITYSWENRNSNLQFLVSRFLRIYPAAIVVVLLAVFVLGPLVTTVSLGDYFNDPLTKQYLQDVSLYRMYYYLPGVFEDNPVGSVNGSLWTLPYEFTCYLVIFLFGLIRLMNKQILVLIIFVLCTLLLFFFEQEVNKVVIPVLGIDFKTFYPRFLYFFAGSIFYSFREKIRFSAVWAVASLVILFFAKDTPVSYFVSIVFLPYLLLCFAFLPPLMKTKRHLDFSYGLYLYAFPIQQIIVMVNPEIEIWQMLLLSFAFTLPLAIFSWYWIEKPSLRLRRYFH